MARKKTKKTGYRKLTTQTVYVKTTGKKHRSLKKYRQIDSRGSDD